MDRYEHLELNWRTELISAMVSILTRLDGIKEVTVNTLASTEISLHHNVHHCDGVRDAA